MKKNLLPRALLTALSALSLAVHATSPSASPVLPDGCVWALAAFALWMLYGAFFRLNKPFQPARLWVLSAVFAALTSILAKVGIDGVNSNLATAIRTVVVLVMAWGMVFITNTQNGIMSISKKSWIFLILSGLATGASWMCYYKALQIGDASKVVPIDKLSVLITLILYVRK